MKTIKVLFVFFSLLLSGMGMGQQLTFRVTNPVIMHTGGSPGYDMFQFDLEVKVDAGTYYLWTGQAQFTFDNSTFVASPVSNWTVTKGTLLLGNNTLTNAKYAVGKNVVGGD